jgi:hypothetical protein
MVEARSCYSCFSKQGGQKPDVIRLCDLAFINSVPGKNLRRSVILFTSSFVFSSLSMTDEFSCISTDTGNSMTTQPGSQKPKLLIVGVYFG